MKGYQRAEKVQEAGSLGDVPRSDTPNHRRVHGDRSDGDSFCSQGRRSYQITKDPTKVTCERCKKLMKEAGVSV